MKKSVLVITDNRYLYRNFRNKIEPLIADIASVDYAYSPKNLEFPRIYSSNEIQPINVHETVGLIISKYNIVISLHSKQIFPNMLVKTVKCINVHPGFNPYNRGWYPHIFSIINKLPAGATIHEMDDQIDHGPIITQKKVEVLMSDTSKTLHHRILNTEISLLKKSISSIVNETYATVIPLEGNYNSIRDFNNLCRLDLKESASWEEVIVRLRALSYGNYKNAYYIDKNSNRVFVNLKVIAKKTREVNG